MCTLLGYYAAFGGNSLQTFQDNLSVPFSRVMKSPLKIGQIGCPETSVRNYCYMLHNIPEECRSLLHRSRSLQWHIAKKNSSNKLKTTWSVFKNNTVKTQTFHKISELNSDNGNIKDAKEIACAFNKYFCNCREFKY